MAHKNHGFAYSVHPFAWYLEGVKVASRSHPTAEIQKADNSASRWGQGAAPSTACLAMVVVLFIATGAAWIL